MCISESYNKQMMKGIVRCSCNYNKKGLFTVLCLVNTITAGFF